MTQRLPALRRRSLTVRHEARAGRPITRHLLVWHRRLGLAAAAIVLLLAVTGLLLNHADRLRLGAIELRSDWLLAWYGFPAVEEVVSYRAGEHWFSWSGTRLYVDDRMVVDAESAPVGAARAADGMFAVAFPDALVLVTASGELVERIGVAALPGEIERVGTLGTGRLLVATRDARFEASPDLTEWGRTDAAPQWSAPAPLPAPLADALRRAERGPGLPAERVLLDLHSGRLFGVWGPWVMDGAAVAFVVLAITGIGNWWRRQRRALRTSRRDGRDSEP